MRPGAWSLTCYLLASIPTVALAHFDVPSLDGTSAAATPSYAWLEQAIAIIAFGLFAGGQMDVSRTRRLLGLVVGVILGLAWATLDPRLFLNDWITLSCALAFGLLIAIGYVLPGIVTVTASILFGIILGVLMMPAPGSLEFQLNYLATGLGAAAVLVFLCSALAEWISARVPSWPRIALRVLGSWIAAVAVLMLAFTLRPA